MHVQEFTASFGQAAPAPVLLFCPGKPPRGRDPSFDPFLAERAVEQVVSASVDPSVRDLAYTTYYADETKAAEIVLEAQTVPFLAERRVVLVRGAERYNTDTGAAALLAYLEAPCDMTVLILVAAQIDRRTKFFKACEKTGLVIECPVLNDGEARQWVRAGVEARGKSIDAAATAELVRRAGNQLSDVNNALTIVVGYVGDAKKIRESDVVAACADVAEEVVWALTDAIAKSEPDKALIALRKLMDLGNAEDYLIGMINWLLKNAYAVALTQKGPPPISPFVAQKVKPLVDKLGVKKLRDAFVLCTDAQFMIRSTGVDSALALELLVVKLAAPVRRTPALEPA